MDPIQVIKSRLHKHPHLRFRESPNAIEVEAPCESGFSVGFTAEPDEFTVHFEGWHEHFETAEEALNCFAMGLTCEIRLAITYRGASPVRYVLQYRDGDSWSDDSTTGLILQPIWRRARTELRENPPLASVEAQE